MKRIILLSMIAATVAFTSCKKEKKKIEIKSASDAIVNQKHWNTITQQHEYFDESNTKVYETTVNGGPKYLFNTNDSVRITDTGLKVYKKYSFSVTNGKEFISLVSNNSIETYEVLSAALKTMTWQIQRTNVQYKDANNADKVAAKEVLTINFHCPCAD
ncbi:hypothetical protein [Rubrolithibacter danxiaensis]|uniref:hypothetical protein n=1 Tax=Rubrolithibacter danxiaensis TaxID=3390805 RepID=UPI003BF7EAB3